MENKKRVNYPAGTKGPKVTVKTTHKSPIKGQSKNVAIYHEKRGRMG